MEGSCKDHLCSDIPNGVDENLANYVLLNSENSKILSLEGLIQTQNQAPLEGETDENPKEQLSYKEVEEVEREKETPNDTKAIDGIGNNVGATANNLPMNSLINVGPTQPTEGLDDECIEALSEIQEEPSDMDEEGIGTM